MKPPYNISGKILKLISLISEKIGEINSAHLTKPPTELRKKNKVKTIHSSLGIEGNTLSEEQITAILDNKRVIGPKKDIIEVKNAIKVYEQIEKFKPYSLSSICKAHDILMQGLIDKPGKLRKETVGIVKGEEVAHIAPPSDMVRPLLNDLFEYLKNGDDPLLLKSCVFHYEIEFIHPFVDGNGRIGRLWQTLILKEYNPVFEFLPIESLILKKQEQYYNVLSNCDKKGESTEFIEFMLEIIAESLEELLSIQNIDLDKEERIESFKDIINDEYFTRKDYLRNFKEISTATASRDLKYGVEMKILKKKGEKNLTKYKYRRTNN
jgi:Fic family protein